MTKRPYRFWDQNDIDFLKQHYGPDGVKFCAKYLDYSTTRITSKAKALGLRTTKKRRKIVVHLSDHKVVAVCPRHGKTLHYYGYKTVLLQCSLCIKDSHYKWRHSDHGGDKRRQYQLAHKRSDPLNNYAMRLRSRLNYYKSLFGTTKIKGCFRYLPFSPKELYDHLEKIRFKQGNQCPVCNINYDEVGYHMDHIMPLALANSEDEMWLLFNLSNLSLLCPQCNYNKGSTVGEKSFYLFDFM